MGWIGGDLGAMDALASRFRSTSHECQNHADSIVRRAEAALEELTTEMTALDTAARALSEDIGERMATLRTQADNTTWTGANRHRQNEIIALLEADITGVRTSVDTFATRASDVVNGSMTSALTEMQGDVRRSGNQAVGAAESFARSVAAQRNAFDLVLNGGPR